MTFLAVLALGCLLGIRHAMDADHVVAVAAIAARERTIRSAMLIGATWGVGHTLTILLVGGAIIAFGLVIPPRLGLSMEFAVAAMLILLGALNLVDAQRATPTQLPRAGAFARARLLRPLSVGLVHGLAGSAAIALLVLTTIHDVTHALLYLGVFGVGTIAGMMCLTMAMAVPIAAASRRSGLFERGLARITGLISVGFGLFLAYQIGIVDGLFRHSITWTPR